MRHLLFPYWLRHCPSDCSMFIWYCGYRRIVTAAETGRRSARCPIPRWGQIELDNPEWPGVCLLYIHNGAPRRLTRPCFTSQCKLSSSDARVTPACINRCGNFSPIYMARRLTLSNNQTSSEFAVLLQQNKRTESGAWKTTFSDFLYIFRSYIKFNSIIISITTTGLFSL